MTGEQGTWSLQSFRKRQVFGNFNASSENFRTFAVGKDNSFEFYREIVELVPPTLQVSRRPWI